ncbi:ABC transporter permease [Candidatus Dependentiae bacterium]
MFKKIKNYINIFWQLLKVDICIYKQNIFTSIVDNMVWIACTILCAAYVLPTLGIFKDYGAFYAVGTIASSTMFELFTTTTWFVSDIDGNKTISYPLTLPIPSWMVLLQKSFGYAVRTMLIMPIMLPLCKILLWNKLSFANFSVLKFILIFFAINFFGGIFSIFMSSIIKDMNHINTAWTRILFPLWFFGSSQFTWQTLKQLSPKLGYLNLLNPLTYPSEGIRAAVLGQKGYISFWICFFATIFFSIILGFYAITKLKKRLDYV